MSDKRALARQVHNLTKSPGIGGLDLGDCELRDEEIPVINEILLSSGLRTLHLWRNLISDDGISTLTSALANPLCRLTKLDLGENNVGDRGVAFLRDVFLTGLCPLRKLFLHGNPLNEKQTNTVFVIRNGIFK
eukprot:c6278_g1_i1.p1 GENE.c6278_g1_i1~~c6278_g1_i1.p1  ORF type:complete len:143 (+),score=34.56 c6278_g1_i1:33-431(+)